MTGSRPAFLIVVASVLIGVSLLSAKVLAQWSEWW